MKIRYLFLPILLICFINCSSSAPKVISEKPDYNKITDNFLNNLFKQLKPEEADKIEMLKTTLAPIISKECLSGNYNLDCIGKAHNIQMLQLCKK